MITDRMHGYGIAETSHLDAQAICREYTCDGAESFEASKPSHSDMPPLKGYTS